MKHPDLIAGLLSLLALITIGAIRVFTGHEIVSTDLQAALGAFVVAALGRWRLSLPRKGSAVVEAPVDADSTEPLSVDDKPSETPTEIPAPNLGKPKEKDD